MAAAPGDPSFALEAFFVLMVGFMMLAVFALISSAFLRARLNEDVGAFEAKKALAVVLVGAGIELVLAKSKESFHGMPADIPGPAYKNLHLEPPE